MTSGSSRLALAFFLKSLSITSVCAWGRRKWEVGMPVQHVLVLRNIHFKERTFSCRIVSTSNQSARFFSIDVFVLTVKQSVFTLKFVYLHFRCSVFFVRS